MREPRNLWLLSLFLVVILVPVALVGGCFHLVRRALPAESRPDVTKTARSAEVTAARVREAAWMNERFGVLARDRSWLQDMGHTITDGCASNWSLFTWGPVSCHRQTTHYYAVDEDLCESVRKLNRIIPSDGWTGTGQRECADRRCPTPTGSTWIIKFPRLAALSSRWYSRQCPPSPLGEAERNETPGTTANTAFVEYRPVDFKALTDRALAAHRYFLRVQIERTYYENT